MPTAKKAAAKETAAKKASAELPIKRFKTAADWEKWVASHHAKSPGLWVQLAKKDSGLRSVTYAEAVTVALCYGWIDGQRKSFDVRTSLQKFTPRGPRSIWSQINREKVQALIDSGRMQPAGLAAIERAKANGQWDAAYTSPKNSRVPDDLQAALDASPAARDFFATLGGANRYAVLYRVQDAKRPETRARRIADTVRALGEGRREP